MLHIETGNSHYHEAFLPDVCGYMPLQGMPTRIVDFDQIHTKVINPYCLMGNHYHLMSEIPEANLTQGMRQLNRVFNLIQDPYIIKVAFVVRNETPYRRREFSRKKRISIDGQDLRVVAPEDLILSKLVWAKDSKSEVQLWDVRNLLRSVKGLDRRYLARWAKQLGVESLYRQAGQ